MTATEVRPGPSDARRALLDAAAAPDLDMGAAREQVDALARARRRVLRATLAGLGAVAVVALGAVVLLGGDDPDELVADREDVPTRSTTTTSSTTSSTVAPVRDLTAAPPTSVAALPAPTTVPVTTTTLAPNQPMRAELHLVTPQVQAGDVAAVEVTWDDADHVGAEPQVLAAWGDPAVTTFVLPTPAPRCDSPGGAASGVLRHEFRYATPGRHPVQMTLTTCGGEGAYAERIVVEGIVEVTEPVLGDGPGRAVVAVAPRSASGLPVLPPLDGAAAVLVPEDPTADEVALDPRIPTLALFSSSGPATVLRLPAGAVGSVRLTWPDSTCTASARVDLSDPAGPTPELALESSC